MLLAGENPIEDYLKRSDEEQHRLWKIGRDENGNKIGATKTNCDGIKLISGHQRGVAEDIYFLDDKFKELVNPKLGWDYWHKYWEMKGGKPVTVFSDGRKDNCHFEG